MKFLLYNIRYGAGADSRFHVPFPYSGYLKRTTENLERITKFIRSAHPDIVGLLEVDSGSYRSRKCNQPAAIARALGHYHVYQSKYATRSVAQRLPLLSKQGNALLTSKEIKTRKCHYFTSGIKRLVIELELKDLVILLVHLSVKFRHRHYQLWELHALIKEAKKPIIVAGDFNVFRGIREVQLFLAATGLKNANMEGAPSYPSWAPRRQLDFILHSPEIRVSGFEAPRVTFSDHLPLICDFELLPRGTRAT
jgi:endonuclease/exonuclease/phosphatase family metal-dependent hydrolase